MEKIEFKKSKFTKTTDKIYENQLELTNKINEIIEYLFPLMNCEHDFKQQVNCTANCKICTKCGVIQYG